MTEPFYRSRAHIDSAGHLHRRARLALEHTAEMGVHGAVSELYRLSPPRELPLPVDYIVGATAG